MYIVSVLDDWWIIFGCSLEDSDMFEHHSPDEKVPDQEDYKDKQKL